MSHRDFGYRAERSGSGARIMIIVGLVILLFMSVIAWIASVEYDRSCGGHLQRAANANTIELAKKELDTAIEYIEKEGMTNGYCYAFYPTPDQDLGFWYTNLKACRDELAKVSLDATQLERTNLLMKLRESLTDQGQSGSQVTEPDGISLYPRNTLFGVTILLVGLATVITAAKRLKSQT